MGLNVIPLLLLLLWFSSYENSVDGNSSTSSTTSSSPPTNISFNPPPPPPTTFMPVSEPPVKVQIIFSNAYESVRTHFLDKNFTEDINSQLTLLFGIAPERISDIEITPNPNGLTVLKFTLTSGGNEKATNAIALNFFGATKMEFIVIKTTYLQLYPVKQYCNWTEESCPKDKQCQPEARCAENQNSPNALYALFVIPIVIIIIVIIIVLLWYFKYKKPAEKRRIDLTELGYVENVSKFGGTSTRRKGTISGLSLADHGVRNEVYSAMGDKYGFSLDNADFSKEPLDDPYVT